MNALKPKTALISLSNKEGLETLVNFLVSQNVKILSTGGTYKAIKEITNNVIEVSDFTGFEEMMDGRVKTLHPKIHAGILARRDQDMEVLSERGYETIDLVVVNLYPFKETIASGCSFEEAIEIGVSSIMTYYSLPIGITKEEVGAGYNSELLLGLLRGKYAFDGIICTDWAIISDIILLHNLLFWVFHQQAQVEILQLLNLFHKLLLNV